MKHGSLFSGIGGFDLAAEWMGWENVFHCEWNEFGQKVLKHHFPKAISYHDITKTDFTIHRGQVDVLTGGFPCQPFSMAGKRKGTDDERYLWHEMLRAVQEIEPTYVIAENVFGITNIDGGLVFEQVCADLESEGYEVQPFIIPAAAKNAPHRRDRVWFVAYSKHLRCPQCKQQGQSRCEQRLFKGLCNNGDATNTMSFRLQQCKDRKKMGRGQEEICREGNKSTNGIKTDGKISNATDTNSRRTQTREDREVLEESNRERKAGGFINDNTQSNWQNFPTKPPVCGGNDGIPRKLDTITFSKWRSESIKAYGNAIVPQVAYEIFKAITL
jgi:DNA (cytosine-5)-methyltransferase 1